MVDFVTPLLTAAFSLAEKVIFSWLEDGKSDVRLSRIESAIAELSAKEANRLRLREDDLTSATDHIIRGLVADSPRLSIVKPLLRDPVLRLDFDPGDADSSSGLLKELKQRLKRMELESQVELKSQVRRTEADSHRDNMTPAYEILSPEEVAGRDQQQSRLPAAGSLSSDLLGDLLRRISEREEPRA